MAHENAKHDWDFLIGRDALDTVGYAFANVFIMIRLAFQNGPERDNSGIFFGIGDSGAGIRNFEGSGNFKELIIFFKSPWTSISDGLKTNFEGQTICLGRISIGIASPSSPFKNTVWTGFLVVKS